MGITIDVDSHFIPIDAFDDEDSRRRFRSRWPEVVFDHLGRSWIVFPERLEKYSPIQRTMHSSLLPGKRDLGFWDSRHRQEWMDQAGFDMQVLVPTATVCDYSLDPELCLGVCRSYNDAVGRVLKRHPGRFIGLAVVPMQDVVATTEELDRAILELGIHAPVIILPMERNLDDPVFWPFYKRVEQLGVPLVLHPDRFVKGGVAAMERAARMHLENALGFVYEGMLAISDLIMNGVLDMFPHLRVGLLETGAGYLPTLMDRLQTVYEVETYGGLSPQAPKAVRDLITKPPEEYVNHFWLCLEVDMELRTVPHLIDRFGADRFMVGSDYPHNLGGGGKGTIKRVLSMEFLTQEQKAHLLGLSACKLFGIDQTTRERLLPVSPPKK